MPGHNVGFRVLIQNPKQLGALVGLGCSYLDHILHRYVSWRTPDTAPPITPWSQSSHKTPSANPGMRTPPCLQPKLAKQAY